MGHGSALQQNMQHATQRTRVKKKAQCLYTPAATTARQHFPPPCPGQSVPRCPPTKTKQQVPMPAQPPPSAKAPASSGDRREHVFKNGLGPRRGGRPKVTASSQDMTGSAHNAGWRGEGQTAGFSLPYFWVVREERGTSSDLQKLTQRTCVCAWACGQRRQQGKEVLDFASRPFPHHRCVHRFLGFGVSFVYSCSEMKCGASRPL
jgi:hypothetical protein